ncbi:MAG TPA: protein kinase [Candidatus Eisenbacteria bacterium]
MSLPAGTRLGPYEIVVALGAGGMGEVYRARDTRLGREVAVKVLPRAMAGDPDRQQRFEAEARAVGSLNHPNIVTIHDVGIAEGAPYLVSEVLEGENLRAVLERGPLGPERACDVVTQVASGLEAAHAKRIVHRDLKPENLFVLPDGRVKILDFGIAKLTRSDSTAEAETTPVFASLTAAGTIMGTVSYMAPEQLRDRPVDQRADLFALGAILYELLSGRQAFAGETAADRVSAILSADPPPLPEEVERAVPGIGAIVARLLAKRPEKRFQSATDFAFALSLTRERAAARDARDAPPRGAERPEPRFRPLTFRDGYIKTARFAPDGQTVVYDAAWGGGATDIYLSRVESPEARALGLQGADLHAVSSTAEMAITLRTREVGGFVRLGTLARVPLVGGRPREIADSVYSADWSPDGKSLAAIRAVDDMFRLEAPLGTVLHSTHAWISHVRYSPDGSCLAFLDHPAVGDNAGHACVVRPGEPARRLTPRLQMVWRLAWRPDGREIWFGGDELGTGGVEILGVSLDGAVRRVYAAPGFPAIEDVARNGDALIQMPRPRMRLETGTRSGGPSSVRDLSWLDWSLLRDLRADGSQVLFDETGAGSAGVPGVYVRPTDGGPAIRLADGLCSNFSADGRWVLAARQEDPSVILVVPTGAGEPKRCDLGGLIATNADWIPGSDSIVITGSRGAGPRRLWRFDPGSGEARQVGDQTIVGSFMKPSPDGSLVVVRGTNGPVAVRLEDGVAKPIPNLEPPCRPAGWAEDGTAIYVFRMGEIPARISRVNVESGAETPWMEIWPAHRSGVDGLNSVRLTPDGERYACSYALADSTLFLAQGLV